MGQHRAPTAGRLPVMLQHNRGLATKRPAEPKVEPRESEPMHVHDIGAPLGNVTSQGSVGVHEPIRDTIALNNRRRQRGAARHHHVETGVLVQRFRLVHHRRPAIERLLRIGAGCRRHHDCNAHRHRRPTRRRAAAATLREPWGHTIWSTTAMRSRTDCVKACRQRNDVRELGSRNTSAGDAVPSR